MPDPNSDDRHREEVPCPRCGRPHLAAGSGETCAICRAEQQAAGTERLFPDPAHATDRAGAGETLIRGDLEPDTRLPATASPAPNAEGPGTIFGRYRLLARLGAGGMGVVWKAWDEELRRVVALKQIRDEEAADADSRKRFVREARLAAKLRHPGIVALHDVGEIEGRQFLTMDYVEGRTLDSFLAERRNAKRRGEAAAFDRLRHEIGLLAEIAEAVAYAHAEGVIHRDLKPANVLLDRAERPCVTDFGLAKEVTAAPPPEGARHTLTTDSKLMGTPAYMSPEQVLAVPSRIGPRTDVWALGVILYEILTGRLPFEAESSWAALWSVVNQDAARPRSFHPHAPAQLEAVCGKAMEREPERRYPTARELGEDLRRWLRGEPVAARPASTAYRLWRKVVRHRTATAAAGALLLVAALAGYWKVGGARVRERALASLLTSATQAVEGALTARRAGSLAGMAAFRPILDGAYAAAVEDLGSASPVPDFCVGRFERAAMREEAALASQEKALGIDPDFAPALYEKAILGARAYERRLDATRAAALAGLGEAHVVAGQAFDLRPEVLEAHDPLLKELKAAAAGATERLKRILSGDSSWRNHPIRLLRVAPERVACVEGIFATLGPNAWTEAKERLETAIHSDATLEEAYEALYFAAAREERWNDGVEACARGVRADEGYLPHRLHRAVALRQLGNQTMDRGGDGRPLYAEAIADLDRVLQLDPICARAWLERGGVHSNGGNRRRTRGEEPSEDYRAAIDDFDHALKLDAADFEAWLGRGIARSCLANRRADLGQGADDLFAAAIADFDQALARTPESTMIWIERGMTHCNQAVAHARRGQAPDASFTAALADLSHAIDLEPNSPEARVLRGTLRSGWGLNRSERGGDPSELFAAALVDLDQALEWNDSLANAWLKRASLFENWSIHRLSHGEDPSETCAKALADFDRALKITPVSAHARLHRGSVNLNLGLFLIGRRQDPSGPLRAALADLDEGIRIHPASADLWLCRGTVWMNLGDFAMTRGEDPGPPFDAAVKDLTKGLELSPADLQGWVNLANTHAAWGDYRIRSGADARESYGKAVSALESCLRVQPRHREAREMLARLQAALQGRDPAAGEPPWKRLLREGNAEVTAGRFAGARKALEEALRLQAAGVSAAEDAPLLTGAHYNLACLLALASCGRAGPSASPPQEIPADAAALRDAAFEHLGRALDLGWTDREHLAADGDLESLRSDPRWKALLERFK